MLMNLLLASALGAAFYILFHLLSLILITLGLLCGCG